MEREKLLVDYLEEAAAELAGKKEKLRELNRQYHEIYDKQIKEEMELVRIEINKKRAEVIETVYENLDEMKHLKKYFPDLVKVFEEDGSIGDILSKKSFLYENSKPINEGEAVKKLKEIKKKKAKLRDAKKFLHDWTGTISAKKLEATYPVLKGKVKGTLEKNDAITIIDRMRAELKRKGWMILINSPLILGIIQNYIAKQRMLELAELQASKAYEQSKGRGTTAEYDAKKQLDDAKKEKKHVEKIIRHLLLANPELLSSLKTARGWKRGAKDPMEIIAENIPINRVKEKAWLEKMKKRLS